MDQSRDTQVYEELADALNALPNGFPRTPSNVEIPMLQKIFTPAEASLARHLGREMETVDAIAGRAELEKRRAVAGLIALARCRLIWFNGQTDNPRFRLSPFIIGIYEMQLDNMDYELAHLIEHYMTDGGAAGIMRPDPAIHRVVPAQSAVKSEWVLPYDDVREILLNAKTFRVHDCVCRKQQDQLGRKCGFPLKTCLIYHSAQLPPTPDMISREEALAVLDKAEDIGLVHTMSNVRDKSLFMGDVGYICNCCGCCCAILRGINDWGIENSVAQANYYAAIDAEQCTACGLCEQRCQVGAVSEQDGAFVVDTKRCIGCGLCVTGCPSGAAKLHPKSDEEIVPPPLDLADWEQQRMQNSK